MDFEDSKELAKLAPDEPEDCSSLLELAGVIGFNGGVREGLLLHPGDKHLIFPIGSTIVVRDLEANTQTFLHGHKSSVSCLTLSVTGKYLASGQVSHMGFPAQVLVWNLETFELMHRFVLHKGKVQDLSFSADEMYLASLGGRDDNKLVIWDVSTGEAVCGATAASDQALTVKFTHGSSGVLVTGGAYNLRIWQLDVANRKLRPTDCQLGQLKRVFTCLAVDEKDQFFYAGTTTGDVFQVAIDTKLFKLAGPKQPISRGITAVILTRKGNLVVGGGDGTVAVMKKTDLSVARRLGVDGAVTSLVLNAAGDHFFVGTDKCNIHLVELSTFDQELRSTCHWERVNDVQFPVGYSEVFATCSRTDIRVWNAKHRSELLRIQVPGLECHCIAFTADGKSIISGWSDGRIRAFGPQTGKLQYQIHDAHVDGVAAVVATKDSRRIISGGANGQVRVWAIGRDTHKMMASMKEHKARINSIQLSSDDTECVTASSDGSVIIWNLERFVRSQCFFASTQFKAVAYHPEQDQLVTTGTDRKLCFWDVVDGQPIRILDGSTDVINALEVSLDGSFFVTGGGERLVKVYGYDEGVCESIGIGHSGLITACKISPDQKTIVSVGEEGAIFMWNTGR